MSRSSASLAWARHCVSSPSPSPLSYTEPSMSLLERIDIRPLVAFYNAEQNKRLIYHAVLGAWLFFMVLCNTLLALFVDATGRAPFYVTLILSLPILYGLTHFVLICFVAVPGHLQQQTQATYSVEDFGDHHPTDL